MFILTLSRRRFRFNLYRSIRRFARKNSNFQHSFVAHSDVISRVISLNDTSKESKFIEELLIISFIRLFRIINLVR